MRKTKGPRFIVVVIGASLLACLRASPAGRAAPALVVESAKVIAEPEVSMAVRGINNSGVCAGATDSRIHVPAHPAILTDLGLIDMEREFGHDCEIADINDRGQLIFKPFQGRAQRSFIWDVRGRVQVRTLGGSGCNARKINNNGDVVGTSDRKDGSNHGFLYAEGRMVDLGTLGGDSSKAASVNERRQVVGTSTTARGDLHAFLWQFGHMQDLGSLGGDITQVYAVNNPGEVVGMSEKRDDRDEDHVKRYHAVMWRHGQIVELETVPCDMSEAYAINDHHIIVGTITLLDRRRSRYNRRAFVWYGGKMRDLNDLMPPSKGIVLDEAICINNSDQVVAYAGGAVVLIQLRLSGEAN